jgi:hypothetical protein
MGIILKSNGSNWFRQSAQTENTFNSIYFINSSSGWIAGSGGTILYTANGGGPLGIDDQKLQVSNMLSLKVFPNPTNDQIKLKYSLKNKSNVRITITDLSGKEIEVLQEALNQPGNYEFSYNVGDLKKGAYICRIIAGDVSESKLLYLIK